MAARQDDASVAVRLEPSGWWLPQDDSYFPQFCQGPAPKHNGFMRDHLQAAFRYVKAWECAIDAGAHVGFWCWDMAQRFKIVHAFEPAPATYQCLTKNVRSFPNVLTYNLAVGDAPSICEIRNDTTRPGNSGSNYIAPGDGEIRIVPLDEFRFAECNFLKVDVEGYELKVLEGARDLIERCRPVISMECTDHKFRDRFGIPEGKAQRWLLKRGYREVWAKRPDKVFVPR